MYNSHKAPLISTSYNRSMACMPQTLIDPVRDSISQVDADTWLIGPLLLHRSKGPCDTSTWYDRDDTASYTVTTAPTPQACERTVTGR
ncbi:hypothetical protein N7507_002707 [Penicillium longicatenatum]|nr:hypothetical protein N7507_002707 [Penicillium longicatenatum]